MLDDQNWPDIDFGFYRFLNTRKNPQNYIYKLEFSHYVFNYFCSSLVHFLSYLSLKQFTKCIFWRLVLQPAGLIGKDWKQQVDNLEGVQRCCKEPCAMCLCPNNSVLMKRWKSYRPLKLGLGGKVRLSVKLWSFYPAQAQSMFHGLGLLKPVPC